MLVWLLRLMVLVVVRKPNRKRSQLRQPRSNNVPSGSQQADRWQDMFLSFFSLKC